VRTPAKKKKGEGAAPCISRAKRGLSRSTRLSTKRKGWPISFHRLKDGGEEREERRVSLSPTKRNKYFATRRAEKYFYDHNRKERRNKGEGKSLFGGGGNVLHDLPRGRCISRPFGGREGKGEFRRVHVGLKGSSFWPTGPKEKHCVSLGEGKKEGKKSSSAPDRWILPANKKGLDLRSPRRGRGRGRGKESRTCAGRIVSPSKNLPPSITSRTRDDFPHTSSLCKQKGGRRGSLLKGGFITKSASFRRKENDVLSLGKE